MLRINTRTVLAALVAVTALSTFQIAHAGAGKGAFVEKNGLVVMEAEGIKIPQDWELLTKSEGFTGEGYIQYAGKGHGKKPGNVILRYPVKITKTGTYEFAWRCSNGEGAEAGDKENDSWLKIVADDYFKITRGKKKNIAGQFWKVHLKAMGGWTWLGEKPNVKTNGSGMTVFATFNEPGVYEIQLSGRSTGHKIDRMVLFHSSVNYQKAYDLKNPPSGQEK